MTTAGQEQAIRSHFDVDAETRRLIQLAQIDLWYGTSCFDESDWKVYPGFEKACKAIRAGLGAETVWLDTQSDYVSPYAPDDTEECTQCDGTDDDCSECAGTGSIAVDLSHWRELDERTVIRILVGRDLAEYI